MAKNADTQNKTSNCRDSYENGCCGGQNKSSNKTANKAANKASNGTGSNSTGSNSTGSDSTGSND